MLILMIVGPSYALLAESTPVTPQDPSTLTLALIGIGTIAAFLVLTRRVPRTRRETPAVTGRLSDQSVSGQSAGRRSIESVEQTPSRGAA